MSAPEIRQNPDGTGACARRQLLLSVRLGRTLRESDAFLPHVPPQIAHHERREITVARFLGSQAHSVGELFGAATDADDVVVLVPVAVFHGQPFKVVNRTACAEHPIKLSCG